jgi:SAM-dependent methyltransferase
MNCRHCQTKLQHVFLDLGPAPPSNNYLSAEDLGKPEKRFPLRLFVCESCWLVQTEDYSRADDLFRSDYAYFSSTSSGWLAHAANYCRMISERLKLTPHSHVIELACNDGYLLRNFVTMGIPCLGIEPTESTAAAAEKLGIPVQKEFFGAEMAKMLAKADLIIGNNVYAHVPDINDFTAGIKTALKPEGIVTLEFPHLLQMIAQCQFDTVYHEHFSYLSLFTVQKIFAAAGLRAFDVEELPTHGGSLRVYGCHADDPRETLATVGALIAREEENGLRRLETYKAFQKRADAIRDGLIKFLHAQKEAGHSVAGYGAAAKGNTLLNYAGITPELLPFICDAAPSKQGKFMPGSHIPILPPAALAARKPDVILILPWNIAAEVMRQEAAARDWGAHFAVAVPEMKLLEA